METDQGSGISLTKADLWTPNLCGRTLHVSLDSGRASPAIIEKQYRNLPPEWRLDPTTLIGNQFDNNHVTFVRRDHAACLSPARYLWI